MVRGIYVVLALVAVMALNACGRLGLHDYGAPEIDGGEAFRARAKRNETPYRGYGENYHGINTPPKIESQTQQEQVFIEKPFMEVNWAKGAITVKGKIEVEIDGRPQVKEIIYEGDFITETKSAYLRPVDNNINSLVAFRCTERCNTMIIDASLMSPTGKKVQRFVFNNPVPFVDVNEEINPTQNNFLFNRKKPESKSQTPKAEPRRGTPAPTKTPPSAPAKVEEEEDGEFEDPAVPGGVPSLITDEMLEHVGNRDVNLADLLGSELFPINLGPKYKGQAIGFYSGKCAKFGKNKAGRRVCVKYTNGRLASATDVAENTEEYGKSNVVSEQVGLGFKSVSRADGIFYGSGLLVKMIEEAGKLFDKAHPNTHFEVNDLSAKNGGRVRPHVSHQNGLDVDIRYPKTANGGLDHEKAWTIIKSFVSLGYVDVIFLNPVRMNDLCRYLKRSNEKDYQNTFGKLYKENGHKTHLHVRLKCTPHNNECIESLPYDKAKFGVCR